MTKSIMKSGAGWKWYGHAGHLCVSQRCAFHLCTAIGDKLISTVGGYYPKQSDEMETIGSGKNDFYETYVFRYNGDDRYGNPKIDLTEIEGQRYPDSKKAEAGHYKYCWKYEVNK